MTVFLSTLSLRRATGLGLISAGLYRISIHALLAESDIDVTIPVDVQQYFYPRSPCGERLNLVINLVQGIGFLSTLSLRRATCCSMDASRWLWDISIHALLAESDCTPAGWRATVKQFLSTLSLRRATRKRQGYHRRKDHFYPRSPCGERPQQTCYERDCPRISIHALLAESD